MHSRPDRSASNWSNLVLPFLAFPHYAAVPTYGRLLATDRLATNHQRTDRLQGASRIRSHIESGAECHTFAMLDAQRTALRAKTQLVHTELARLTDMVGLFKALGGGWMPSPIRSPV